MQVKLLSTTNELFKCLEGIRGVLNIDMRFSFDFREAMEGGFVPIFDLRRGYMYSSTIKTINYNEVNRNYFHIIVSTGNSTYIFEHGKKNDEKPFTKEEIDSIVLAHLF